MAVREAQRVEYLGNLHFEWSEVGKAMLDLKVWLTYVMRGKKLLFFEVCL